MKTIAQHIDEIDAIVSTLPDHPSVIREPHKVTFGPAERGIPIPQRSSVIRDALYGLKTGETTTIHDAPTTTVGSYASQYGRKWNRKFKISTTAPGRVRVWRVE